MELIDSGNAEVIPFNAQGREPDLPESKIYVCGDHDEIMEIVKLALKDNSISLEIWDHESFKRGNMDLSTDIIGEKLGDCFRGNLETNRKSIVLYWDESYKDLLESIDNIKAINVLH